MVKALLHCTGKYLKHTGLVDILIQTDTFSIKVVEAFVAGTYYVRSVRGKLVYVAFKIMNTVINIVNCMFWLVCWFLLDFVKKFGNYSGRVRRDLYHSVELIMCFV